MNRSLASVLIGYLLIHSSFDHFSTANAFIPTAFRRRPLPGSQISLDTPSETTRPRLLQRFRPYPVASTFGDGEDRVEAEDLEALQKLFSKFCDGQGLMTKVSVMQIPSIAELMLGGDLLAEEFNDIWDKAPKFPDVDAPEERIDVDSFVQIYRDIDDMFEDEEDGKSGDTLAGPVAEGKVLVQEVDVPSPATTTDDKGAGEDDETMEAELESIFDSLCDKNKLLSKQKLKSWDEVSKLMEEGLLGDDEFEELWEKTKKSPGASDLIDVDAFLSFNVALDGLFAFDDEEIAEDDPDDIEGEPAIAMAVVVDSESLSPEQLFAALASESGRVERRDLERWSEMNDWIADGDVVESEVDEIFERAAKGAGSLDRAGFLELYQEVDGLFEEERDDATIDSKAQPETSLKEALVEALDELNDPDLLPCGLECDEAEQRRILRLVTDLEKQPENLVRARNGDVSMADLAGTWELLYSSSSAMRFNQGLSGLGGSIPNGKFGGLKQTLKASKFIADAQYVERIEVTPSTASFDVTVTGDWELRKSVSLFTNEPSLVLTVTPLRVVYGPTSTRADHWKSLGPMNMLDVSYLDDDLRIMRGNTAVDTIFVFRRSSP